MANLGSNFYQKLVKMSSELGMRPEDILAVMVSESGLNPAAVEKKHKGSGLIGFMPDTLKNLGFKGKWNDFIELPGEDQLDFVRTFIKSKMNVQGGRPFSSAAQYYVANFWPAALKLRGIQEGDPNTIFIEENPRVIKDPKTGAEYSKKYYDVGLKIPASNERGAYQANPLFHGKTAGAITYADMLKRLDQVKKMPTYTNALRAMKQSTGYDASIDNNSKPQESLISSFLHKLENLVNQFMSLAETKSSFLISVGSSSDFYTTMEYARVLSAAIDEYLLVKSSIRTEGQDIEIECSIPGNPIQAFDALKELSVGIGDAFKQATSNIGSISTFALVSTGSSKLDELAPQKADRCYRMFKLKFARNNE